MYANMYKLLEAHFDFLQLAQNQNNCKYEYYIV